MTRMIIIKLSVILNTLSACENVQISEINLKISLHQQSLHSNDAIENIHLPKEINVKGTGDTKSPVSVDNNIPQEHKMKRSYTEGLLDQPLATG